MTDLRLPLCATICGSLLLGLCSDVAQAAQQKVWKLQQISDFYGQQAIIWNQRHFRLELESAHLVAVAQAPSWDLSVFNTQSHRYCLVTFQDFRRRYFNVDKDVTRLYVPGNERPRKVDKQLAKQYIVSVSHPGPSRFRGPEVTEMWICAMPMPPIMRQSFALVSHVPANLGLPLTIYGIRDQRRQCQLRTISVRQVTMDAAEFRVPEGMQKMNNELALFLDQDEQQGAVFSDIAYLSGKGTHDKK